MASIGNAVANAAAQAMRREKRFEIIAFKAPPSRR
jgi:hypothetical protein